MIRRLRRYVRQLRMWAQLRPSWRRDSMPGSWWDIVAPVLVTHSASSPRDYYSSMLERVTEADYAAAHAELVQPHPVLDNPARSGDDAEEHY